MIGGDGGILVVVIVTAAVRVVVALGGVLMSNLFNSMLCGSICGAGSCSGVTIGFGGSFLAHHHHHQNHNQEQHH